MSTTSLDGQDEVKSEDYVFADEEAKTCVTYQFKCMWGYFSYHNGHATKVSTGVGSILETKDIRPDIFTPQLSMEMEKQIVAAVNEAPSVIGRQFETKKRTIESICRYDIKWGQSLASLGDLAIGKAHIM